MWNSDKSAQIGYGLAAQAQASMNFCMRSATISPARLFKCTPTARLLERYVDLFNRHDWDEHKLFCTP